MREINAQDDAHVLCFSKTGLMPWSLQMEFNRDIHHRRSIRLKDHDYSTAGAYFVTPCTFNRKCILGDVIGGEVQLSDTGAIVQMEWERSAEMRYEVHLDEFVVMRNHLHGVVLILGHDMQPLVGATGGCYTACKHLRATAMVSVGCDKRSPAGRGTSFEKTTRPMRLPPVTASGQEPRRPAFPGGSLGTRGKMP